MSTPIDRRTFLRNVAAAVAGAAAKGAVAGAVAGAGANVVVTDLAGRDKGVTTVGLLIEPEAPGAGAKVGAVLGAVNGLLGVVVEVEDAARAANNDTPALDITD
ncbi:MAG: hypothetical protein WAX89_06885 [Alphaproteobacteria bacterium]